MKKISLLIISVAFAAAFCAAQNVGIGTATPSAKLHVNGTFKITDGTQAAGKVLTSDANGLTSWKTPTAATSINSDSSFVYVPQTGSINSYNLGGAVTTSSDTSGYLYDSGGPNGNYGNNEDNKFFIAPPLGAIQLRIQFISFATESPYDSLTVSKNGSLYKSYAGSQLPALITANSQQLLIFNFKSNAVNNAAGFKIRWDWVFAASTLQNSVAPSSGWLYIPEKLAVVGGMNTNNDWHRDSVGLFSFSYGADNKNKGDYSTTIGILNKATGYSCVAIGNNNLALGGGSSAIGDHTTASGSNSTAMGSYSTASGISSTAIGDHTNASEYNSTAMGGTTTASGYNSTAMGGSTTASGGGSTAMGIGTTASGRYSTAMGSSTTASGNFSTAMGGSTTASGQYSTAMGDSTIVFGYASTAMGYRTNANGDFSTAMGYQTYALGNFSTTIGYQSTASNNASIAIGTQNNSSGQNAITIGTANYATGIYSTAMGTKMNPVGSGSFGIGDLEFGNTAADITGIGEDNQFVSRFRGGYFLISSANAPGGSMANRTGVKMLAGQNSWSAISDVRRKENFAPIDGEDFLIKIAKMPLTSWNYKAQDPTIFRHYGPMAQDFFAAFGKDKYGSIGCDTLINQQDFLGVNLVAIQALEKRTTLLSKENATLKNEMLLLKKEMDELKRLLQKR